MAQMAEVEGTSHGRVGENETMNDFNQLKNELIQKNLIFIVDIIKENDEDFELKDLFQWERHDIVGIIDEECDIRLSINSILDNIVITVQSVSWNLFTREVMLLK